MEIYYVFASEAPICNDTDPSKAAYRFSNVQSNFQCFLNDSWQPDKIYMKNKEPRIIALRGQGERSATLYRGVCANTETNRVRRKRRSAQRDLCEAAQRQRNTWGFLVHSSGDVAFSEQCLHGWLPFRETKTFPTPHIVRGKKTIPHWMGKVTI